MVYVVIILAAVALMSFVFGLFGNLPPTPDWLVGTADGAIDLFRGAIYTFSWLIGPHLFFLTLGVIVTLLLWEQIYHLIMWVLRKIPILNIK